MECLRHPVCSIQRAPYKSCLPNAIKITLDKGAATLWRWWSLQKNDSLCRETIGVGLLLPNVSSKFQEKARH